MSDEKRLAEIAERRIEQIREVMKHKASSISKWFLYGAAADLVAEVERLKGELRTIGEQLEHDRSLVADGIASEKP